MKLNKKIVIVLVIAFLLRLLPIDFPMFTADEARIAVRGYTLSKNGTDELGRKFPVIFNSLDDYQLPLTSYLTALGILIFGKNDFGARIMFILIGTITVFSTYKLSKLFLEKDDLSIFAAVVACFSPGLIFFSKFPNEFILAAFSITLLLLLLLKKTTNIVFVILIILMMFLTTKIFWFALTPLLLVNLFINKETSRKKKLYLLLICIFVNLLTILVFIRIPQGLRSLAENNLSIINDVTIKNAVERLRSQTSEIWSPFWDRILFSKIQFLIAGIFHWIYHLQPSVLFAELDNSGKYGFLNLGVFTKVMIIPFVIGVVGLVKEKQKLKYLFFYFISLTFPLIFLYPNFKPEYIISILPIFTLIISLGFRYLSLKMVLLIFSIATIEYLANLYFISASFKNANDQRPFWIREIVSDGYAMSKQHNVAFSDNITSDIIPFLEWHTPVTVKSNLANIHFPYKFRQPQLGTFKIIGSGETFYKCSFDNPTYIIASERDDKEIRRWLNLKPGEMIKKVYKDGLSNEIAFSFEPTVCVH